MIIGIAARTAVKSSTVRFAMSLLMTLITVLPADGRTIRVICNCSHTLIREVKSATDIKFISPTQAEVQFILFGEWVVAKLI